MFDRDRPSRRPDLATPRAARTAEVKARRRRPPQAARSGLERSEHTASIAAEATAITQNPIDLQQSIFETALRASSG
jgi:hypothetical protein